MVSQSKEYQQKWRDSHRESTKTSRDKWRNNHPKEVKEYAKKHWKECKDKITEYRKNPKSRFEYCVCHAKYRNLEFKLSFEEFMLLWQKPCYYCGNKIETIGLDRVDNLKGYYIDNVIPCCIVCNKQKSTYTKDDFINHAKKIATFQGLLAEEREKFYKMINLATENEREVGRQINEENWENFKENVLKYVEDIKFKDESFWKVPSSVQLYNCAVADIKKNLKEYLDKK